MCCTFNRRQLLRPNTRPGCKRLRAHGPSLQTIPQATNDMVYPRDQGGTRLATAHCNRLRFDQVDAFSRFDVDDTRFVCCHDLSLVLARHAQPIKCGHRPVPLDGRRRSQSVDDIDVSRWVHAGEFHDERPPWSQAATTIQDRM